MKSLILRWLGLHEVEGRLKDVERHFVTKRDADGKATETLADVPFSDRKKREARTAGMSWGQRRAWLEMTDGGRRLG